MFATLSSLLPAAAREKHPPPPPPPQDDQQPASPTSATASTSPMAADDPAKKRKDRTHESFIVVRPPPSKSNHPLNLQVQLVPPTGRQPTIVRRSQSIDSDAGDIALARTTSHRSEVTAYSSVTSLATVSSTSTSSTRRMIIPLYNLQAHNVMTNVIVDAGTDAKIAKFLKRGLEVIGLTVLEPIELVGGARYEALGGPAHGMLSVDLPRTPTSSHLSLTSDGAHDATPQPQYASTSATSPIPPMTPTPASPAPASGARRLFGKVFRRKDQSSLSSLPVPPTSPSPARSPIQAASPLPQLASDGRSSKRSSLLIAGAGASHPYAYAGEPSPLPPTPATAMPTVLGIQPMLRSASPYPPNAPSSHRKRPTSYVWVARKWLKEPIVPGAEVLGMVEIRLDWTRGQHKKRGPESGDTGRRERRASGSAGRRSSVRSKGSSTTSLRAAAERRDAEDEEGSDQSQSPRTSTASASTESHRRAPGGGDDDDDDGDSDPEDSETPWTCHLVVRRLYAPGQGLEDARVHDATMGNVRVKVGAVVPAPHHPKVVALLKVPFPLPDVHVRARRAAPGASIGEVEVEARKRVVTPAGVARPATEFEEAGGVTPSASGGGGNGVKGFISAQSGKWRHSGSGNGFHGGGAGAGVRMEGGLLLSAEEIKDVVCCTALWVIVREGFGGVGKVSRKGDGWRIRG